MQMHQEMHSTIVIHWYERDFYMKIILKVKFKRIFNSAIGPKRAFSPSWEEKVILF